MRDFDLERPEGVVRRLAGENRAEADRFGTALLSRLSVEQVVDLRQGISRGASALMNAKITSRYAKAVSRVDRLLQEMLTSDQPRARLLWTGFANSHRPQDRRRAGRMALDLSYLDPVFAVPYWTHLLRDPDPTVRSTTYGGLSYVVLVGVDHQPDWLRENWGLTWQDVASLQWFYVRAEHGHVRAVPSDILGDVALRAAARPSSPDRATAG